MGLAENTCEGKGKNRDMIQDSMKKRLFTYKPASDQLDEVNIRLLQELIRDPRLSMTELGRRAAMSAPAVSERVRRMEETGIIGYRLEINPGALGLPISAYIRIRPNP